MNIRRFFAFALAVLMLLSLVGCQKKKTTTDASASDVPTVSTEPTASVAPSSKPVSASFPTFTSEPSVSVTPPSESGSLTTPPSESESLTPPTSEPIEQVLRFQPEAKQDENGNIVVEIILSNNVALAGYGISLLFDAEKLEVVSQRYHIAGGFTATNLKTPGRVLLQCTVPGGNRITENGKINTVTFKLKDGVSTENLKLTFEIAKVDNMDIVYTYDTVTHTSQDVYCLFGKTEYSIA